MSDQSRKIWNEKNKDKVLLQHKEHYQKNKETHKKRMKLWRENNPEKCKEIVKNWERNNQEKNKKYHKENDKKQKPIWFKKNYDNDINFKIIQILRTRVSTVLKNNLKSHSTKELLGCSIQECRNYLENQFKPEMTWDNYGKVWEIDHIKPCSSFNFLNKDDQHKCFHYTNLQPLFKTTKIAQNLGYLDEIGNRNKSNKILI